VIAVLTKYEALVDRVKGECGARVPTRTDVSKYAKKNVIDPLKNTGQLAAFVQTHRKSAFELLFPCKISDVTVQIKVKVVNCWLKRHMKPSRMKHLPLFLQWLSKIQ
jgi:hypothetical protein